MRRTLLVAGLLAAFTSLLPAQEAAPASLGVFGFTAGAHLRDVALNVWDLEGSALRCDRSRLDARVNECRATLSLDDVSGPVELWMSAIDSVSGVLTLAGNLSPDEFDALRSGLERRYGRVNAQVQGQQWMMQWVRSRRMLRLTWKVQQGAKATSVSMVDGRVLDGWQAPRRSAPAKAPAKPAPKKPAAPAPGVEVQQGG